MEYYYKISRITLWKIIFWLNLISFVLNGWLFLFVTNSLGCFTIAILNAIIFSFAQRQIDND